MGNILPSLFRPITRLAGLGEFGHNEVDGGANGMGFVPGFTGFAFRDAPTLGIVRPKDLKIGIGHDNLR